jgi:hypothetical protein
MVLTLHRTAWAGDLKMQRNTRKCPKCLAELEGEMTQCPRCQFQLAHIVQVNDSHEKSNRETDKRESTNPLESKLFFDRKVQTRDIALPAPLHHRWTMIGWVAGSGSFFVGSLAVSLVQGFTSVEWIFLLVILAFFSGAVLAGILGLLGYLIHALSSSPGKENKDIRGALIRFSPEPEKGGFSASGGADKENTTGGESDRYLSLPDGDDPQNIRE